MSAQGLRAKLGCWANERWRLEIILRWPRLAKWLGMSWLDLCNRHERLLVDEVSGGRICPWPFSSALTVTRIFPETASRLVHHVHQRWPVDLEPVADYAPGAEPDASIIIGVRGTGRLPQFEACLRTLQAQKGARVEIIVVEQSWQPEFAEKIPPGVRYVHQQCTSADMPYNRSWALNGGARVATGRVLVLYDADMLLPEHAVAEICRVMDRGVEALRLPRLVFYLDRQSSEAIQANRSLPESIGAQPILANTRTPIAVARATYFEIGGHDEVFYGWGCEDDEFMARLRTRRISEGAMLPILHLWHPSAAAGPSRERNIALRDAALARPLDERIAELRARDWGAARPSVAWNPGAPAPAPIPEHAGAGR